MIAICLLLCILLFALYMIKVAHEHHIIEHTAIVHGKTELIRVLFISDVHNRRIKKTGFNEIGTVDAVIIGGDFCDRRTSQVKLGKNLQLLQTIGPVYFVWGNNDREFGEQKLRQLFAKYAVTVVENDAIQLANCVNTIWISAIDDTSTKNYDFPKALEKCNEMDVVLFVSHNPQVFYKALQIKKPSLLFGGHLHGGQIRLGKYGIHPHGSYSIRNGVPTLISNGYGTTLLPMRLGAKPQLHVVDIFVQSK